MLYNAIFKTLCSSFFTSAARKLSFILLGERLESQKNKIRALVEKVKFRLSYYQSSLAVRIMNFLLGLVFMVLAKKERKDSVSPKSRLFRRGRSSG